MRVERIHIPLPGNFKAYKPKNSLVSDVQTSDAVLANTDAGEERKKQNFYQQGQHDEKPETQDGNQEKAGTLDLTV